MVNLTQNSIIGSKIFSKVNLLKDDHVKETIMAIYNYMSLNVFLYDLPDDMIQVVQLQGCDKLEDAFFIVMEEVNFLNQQNSRNKNRQNLTYHKPLQYNIQHMPNFKAFISQQLLTQFHNSYGPNFKITQRQNFDTSQNKFP